VSATQCTKQRMCGSLNCTHAAFLRRGPTSKSTTPYPTQSPSQTQSSHLTTPTPQTCPALPNTIPTPLPANEFIPMPIHTKHMQNIHLTSSLSSRTKLLAATARNPSISLPKQFIVEFLVVLVCSWTQCSDWTVGSHKPRVLAALDVRRSIVLGNWYLEDDDGPIDGAFDSILRFVFVSAKLEYSELDRTIG
jgi:hypothetical protein